MIEDDRLCSVQRMAADRTTTSLENQRNDDAQGAAVGGSYTFENL
jgi:hypothetical protein